MDILDLLKQAGLSPETDSSLAGAYIMKPVYDPTAAALTVPLHAKAPLSFDSYTKLSRYLSVAAGCKCRLIIQADQKHITANEVRSYISCFFNNDVSLLKGAFPQEIGDQNLLIISEDQRDSEPLRRLAAYLAEAGIKISCRTREEMQASGGYARQAPAPAPKAPAKTVPAQPGRLSPGNKVHIRELSSAMDNVTVEGQLYEKEYITTKKGSLIMVAGIHEGNDAITIKAFEGRHFSKDQFDTFQPGSQLLVRGNAEFDEYANGIVLLASAIEICEPLPPRTDAAPVKRIELHVQTNKSEMDGINECTDLLKAAHDFGMPAMAITDHDSVQAFPDAQTFLIKKIEKAHKDDPFKVIYGIEMSTVHDRAVICLYPNDQPLKDAEYCVFDLETSGLSNRYDEIIEFGAVKLRNGAVIDRLQSFIRPAAPLTDFTKEFTGIRQEDVDKAPSFKEFAGRIQAFCAKCILVAHNGSFDYGFLDASFQRAGLPKPGLPMIDTLPLARCILSDRSAYRLGNLAHFYHIEYNEEEAHRADYDAEVLGSVFTELMNAVPDHDKLTVRQLDNIQTSDIYKKNHASHVDILAKDRQGIKDIYDLVTLAHTQYLSGANSDESAKKSAAIPEPRIPLSEIAKRRSHILVGSGCEDAELFEIACNRSQEELEACMAHYDYIEVQPPGNYLLQIDESSSFNTQRLLDVLRNIIETAKRLGKPAVATGNCHFKDPDDKLIWDIYIYAKRIGGSRHPLYYQRAKHTDCPDLHLLTTEEMLKAFDFLDPETAKQIVIDNPRQIAGQIERMKPLYTDVHTPHIDGCDQLLKDIVYKNARDRYGDPLPELVEKRLDREFNNVVQNGYAVQYYIAYLLVKRSHENGYVVGSRGSVGSSFLATMANITEVNPLPPHYVCPQCHHSEFFLNGEIRDGFDLPHKKCPVCGADLQRDGHNIPFETFLGFKGDKVPDIDLNFSGEYQNKAQLQIKEIFGADSVFAAGTIGTVEFKTAVGYVRGYIEDRGLAPFSDGKLKYLANKCVGVRRTTGQHPAGIVVCPKTEQIHDFTPLQYPANNNASPWKTTHFAIKDLHDTILKLDILGHVDPTAIKLLKEMSGVDPTMVDFNDAETLSLFTSTDALKISDGSRPYTEGTGAVGLPEFGTRTSRGVIEMTKPRSFADLVSLEGLTHGTDVWKNNAQDLISSKTCATDEVIACRDDIMTYLMQMKLDSKDAFDIMESVRHGRGLNEQWIKKMQEHSVPQWYIESCQKIQYMFPKAHAVAYCMMAMRIAWFKVHLPEYYYAVFFSCRADAYEIECMTAGEEAIYRRLREINEHRAQLGRGIPAKETALYDVLEVAYEMYRRGYQFTNIDLSRSDASRFIVDPLDHTRIIPPFTSIDGLGTSVGDSIVQARQASPFLSKEDLMQRTQVNNSQLEFMERTGVLGDLQDTNQISLF